MTQLPRLFTRGMQPADILYPITYSLTDKLTPLSTAAITLPHDAPDVPLRAFVELFTANGSAGIFRVTNRRRAGVSTIDLTLQHGLCTLSDHMHPGESEDTGSCRTLLTKLLSNQSIWVLGTVDVPDDEDLTWSCNNTNDLQGLTGIMKELPGYYLDFDQSTQPWVLHVRRKPEEISCEARIDRNLVDVQVEDDTSDMCNVAYADGLDAPIVADNVNDWDRIERHVSADEDMDADILRQTVERYLEQHKDPRVTITLTALELSRLTGEPFDSFRKGQLCRCILDDTTVVQRIEAIEYPDPIGSPDEVVLTLASTQNDLSVTVAGLVVDTRVVNQLYHQLDRKLKIEAEEIRLRAYKSEVNGLSTRVGDAEIALNDVLGEMTLQIEYSEKLSADVNLFKNQVAINMDAVNAELTAKATHDDLEDGLNEVYIRLDAQDDEIELKANRTYVDNLIAQYVLTKDFESLRADVAALEAMLGDFTIINTDTINASDANFTFLDAAIFSFGGSTVSKRSITMGDISTAGAALSTGDLDLSHSHLITEENGIVTLGEVSSTGGSFNIADTQFYKDGVAAAIESVTMTYMGWQSGNGIVEASNGKTQRVPLPDISIGGGDLFVDKKTTVTVNVETVPAAVATKEIDATSVFDAGVASVIVYSPTVDSVEHPGGTSHLMRVYMAANASNGAVSAIVSELINAQPVYDVGYDDGYAAGYQAAKDATKVVGGITSIVNTAQDYYQATGWASAQVDGEQVDYTTFSKAQAFG